MDLFKVFLKLMEVSAVIHPNRAGKKPCKIKHSDPHLCRLPMFAKFIGTFHVKELWSFPCIGLCFFKDNFSFKEVALP